MAYADNAKLYVPVSSLHLISRYGGVEEANVNLNKLGTDKWAQAKRKAAEKSAIPPLSYWIFTLAVKQKKALLLTSQIKTTNVSAQAFLTKKRPTSKAPLMPYRKICVRHAPWIVWFAVMSVLVKPKWPCVPLYGRTKRQTSRGISAHHLARSAALSKLADRFADWPVKVDVLSRFKSEKETQQALESMLAGKTDIVVGTHKLLQKT